MADSSSPVENGDVQKGAEDILLSEFHIPKEGGSQGPEGANDENKMRHSDIVYLPPEKWTPEKVRCRIISDDLPPEKWTPTKPQQDTSEPCESPRKHSEKKKLCYEEIIQLLEEKILNLLKQNDFSVPEPRVNLKFVQRQTRYSPDVVLNRRIVDKIVKLGIGHVFLRVWQSVSQVDYLQPVQGPAFKNLQTMLSILWNCTDKSVTLCDSLVRCGIVQLFLEELSTEKLKLSDLSDENELYLVKAYLGMLHNIVRLCRDSRKIFRSANAVVILQRYLHSGQDLVKTKAYLILSYIFNETENNVINSTDENIKFIIDILQEALESENHFSKKYAFWATEIVCGLNHLAVNDSNKVRILRQGALPLYVALMQGETPEEQNLAVAGLWILAFHDENKYCMRDSVTCMEALKTLASENAQESVRRSARAALWVIRTIPQRPVSPAKQDTSDLPHVMISYHWDQQGAMLKVRNRLRMAGFKVWMDVDNMSGSTLEAMALAVERAAVVLVCLAQGYKDSPSCRTEAEYTYRQHKDIIPILLQQGYVPDGWLGILVGAKLYIDLSTDEKLEANTPRLIKELGRRGRYTAQSQPEAFREHSDLSSDSLSSSLSSTSSLHSYMRTPSAKSWSAEHLRHWLQINQLIHIADRLESFTGELLLQYKKVMQSAPEYFYQSLERHLKFDLVTSLHFAKALETIS